MPPLPSPGKVLKSRLHFTVEGDTLAQVIQYWTYTGTCNNQTDLDSFTDAISTAVLNRFAPLMETSVTYTENETMDLSSNTGLTSIDSNAAVGSRSGTRLAPGTAALVNHGISRRYRGGKPRSYFPFGVSADIQTSGTWASAFATAVSSAVVGYIGDVVGSYSAFTVVSLANVSYYEGSTVVISPTTGRARNVPTRRATPIVDDIVSSVCSQTIGSQRRRNRDA